MAEIENSGAEEAYKGSMEQQIPRGTTLKKLIRLFRTNTLVKHHFQVDAPSNTEGTARAFFKNAYAYQQSVIPGYSGYDRFARYSDYAEMESYPVLANALNIVSDEVTQKNENGKIISVSSENKELEKTLQSLFDNVLGLNGKNIWKLTRNLLKYGDCFYLLDITEENGVVNMIRMPANEVEKEEGFDKDDPSAVRFRWTAKQNLEIPNAYVAHFKLDGNDMFHPYGMSMLEPARRPWRQLVLLEDSMMVYRITRAPERRVFFLDVMGVPPDDIPQVVNKFNETIKKQKVVDEQGRFDLRYGATLDAAEDYVIPVRGGETGTRIDTLPGGQNLGDIEDIEFIRANLFSALGIPKAFLTFDQDIKSKQVLTQEDIRFARTVSRIHEVIIAELVKIAMIHLYVKGHRGDDLVNFNIRMTNPSTVAELQKMELWRARMDLVMSAKEGMFDTTFIYKNFLNLSDDAVEKIKKGQIQDKMFQAKLLKIENAEGMVAGGMGGGFDMGLGGGLGGAMPMPGAGGAQPNMGGFEAPPGAPSMGEGIEEGEEEELVELKDLGRDSSGNFRTKEKRGHIDLSMSGDAEDDPHDLAGIRRTITSPMGGRESVEIKKEDFLENLKELAEISSMYNSFDSKKSLPQITEAELSKYIGSKIKNHGNTRGLLTESVKNQMKNLYEKIDENQNWEEQLEKLEEKANNIIKEIELLNK